VRVTPVILLCLFDGVLAYTLVLSIQTLARWVSLNAGSPVEALFVAGCAQIPLCIRCMRPSPPVGDPHSPMPPLLLLTAGASCGRT
jgi:hypothetical protein